jgi:hypothetical protein
MSQYGYLVYEIADPEEVSRVTGVVPSQVKPRRNGLSSWRINTEADSGVLGIEPLVRVILERLEPAWDRFVELSQRFEPQVVCVVHVEAGDSVPSMALTAETIRKLAEIGASLDIDLYVMD